MLFATRPDDERGMIALEILKEGGYETLVLEDGDRADDHSIALFTPVNQDSLTGARNKYLRTSAVQLSNEFTPEWAHTTLFRVGVLRLKRQQKDKHRDSSLRLAVLNMAREYEKWLAPNSNYMVPWSNYKLTGTSDSYRAAVARWLAQEAVKQFRYIWVIKKEKTFSTFQLQGWRVNHTDQTKVFPASAAEQAILALAEWSKYFPAENTWIRSVKDVPSLVVRFDCIVEDGKLVIYEIEERPAGIGLSGMISPDFASQFTRIAHTWDPFRVVVSPLRKATDDGMWQKFLPWNSEEQKLVLVRAEPEEDEFHGLETLSVSSLKAKGDKGYGEGMGLWKRVNSVDELSFDDSFVLKPLQGSKLRDLEIWDPQRRPGSSIRAKVEAALAKNGTMFCQQLHAPMQSGHDQFPWMIFRIFAGYNFSTGGWEILGGNWNARNNLRIHGASDALFGPAVVE